MLIDLPFLPTRENKPRTAGLTMIMDKGLSLREAEDLVSVAHPLIDYIKLGFGTSLFTNLVEEKIKCYHNAGIKVYLGGTLFEAFIIRNKYEDYKKLISKLNIETIEISDGSMTLDHNLKCDYINKLSKDFTVISEVGSKEAGVIITPERWVGMMENELLAGSIKVICEARESGTVGIYGADGKANSELIDKILAIVPQEKILWEAPLKSQQVWFIKHFGANVNLGNIAPNEIISLETLRMGLRGDTFMQFLPKELNN